MSLSSEEMILPKEFFCPTLRTKICRALNPNPVALEPKDREDKGPKAQKPSF